MKYIKLYESIENVPQIGDYVICEDFNNADINLFISSNIGKFVRYTKDNDPILKQFNFIIQYENIPENIKSNFGHADDIPNCRGMSISEILYFSPDKKYLEQILEQIKYNI